MICSSQQSEFVKNDTLVLCAKQCDYLFGVCQNEGDVEDSTSWCEEKLKNLIGKTVVVTDREEQCWNGALPADPSESLVGGEGLKPLYGWSTYEIRVELRDENGNGARLRGNDVLEARLRTGERVHLRAAAGGRDDVYLGTYTLFQQKEDALMIKLNGVALQGSPFQLRVEEKPHCSANSEWRPQKPTGQMALLCPEYANVESCCGPSNVEFVKQHPPNPSCAKIWRRILCAATCDSLQSNLLRWESTQIVHMAISPPLCFELRKECHIDHCNHEVKWGNHRALRISVSGGANSFSGQRKQISIAHSMVMWSQKRIKAGSIAKAELVLRDKFGQPAVLSNAQELKLWAIHIPTASIIPFQRSSELHTRLPLTKMGPYLLKGTLDNVRLGLPATLPDERTILWVDSLPPVVPPVYPNCPDKFGNVHDCEMLKGKATCDAIRITGMGLVSMVTDHPNTFTISFYDALHNAIAKPKLTTRVELTYGGRVGVVETRKQGSTLYVSYRVPRDEKTAELSVYCNGNVLERFVVHRRVNKNDSFRNHVYNGKQNPPVTLTKATLSDLGTSIIVTFDQATNTPSNCQALYDSTNMGESSCHWSFTNTLIIVLGYQATISISDPVTINGGVILPENGGSTFMPETMAPLDAPISPVIPLVSISVASRSFEAIDLDASGSTLLGGREATWNWDVDVVSGMVSPTLSTFVSSSTGPRVVLDATTVGNQKAVLRFSVTATNWMGNSGSSASVKVFWSPVADPDAPNPVRINGPSVFTTSPSSVFVMRGEVGDAPPEQVLDYAWFPTTNAPFVFPSINRVLADTKNILYQPQELMASNSPYLLSFAATYSADSLLVGGSSAVINVVPSIYPLNPGGAFGVSTVFPRSSPLTLDASGSVDPLSQNKFTWTWNCTRQDFDGMVKSCFQENVETTFLFIDSPILFVPPSYLLPGVSVFTLEIQTLPSIPDVPSSLHFGTVSVEAVLPEVPVVNIEAPMFGLHSPRRRLILLGTAYDPHFAFPCELTSYQWTVEPSLDLAFISETSDTQRNLQLPPNTLEGGRFYTFTLCVTSLKGKGCSSVVIQANTPPSSGFCSASLLATSASIDQIAITCNGWEDFPQQGPLLYRFYYVVDGEEHALSTAFTTANGIIASVASGVREVFAVVSDGLGCESASIRIDVSSSSPAIPVSSRGTMSQYVGQDRNELALSACFESPPTQPPSEMVLAFTHMRVERRPETVVAMLQCAQRLVLLLNTTSDVEDAKVIVANVTFILKWLKLPNTPAWDKSAYGESFQLATDIVAYVIDSFEGIEFNDLVREAWEEIGNEIFVKTAPGAIYEEYRNNVTLVRGVSSESNNVARFQILAPNATSNITNPEEPPFPPLPSSHDAIQSLYVVAGWNPVPLSDSELCGSILFPSLSRNGNASSSVGPFIINSTAVCATFASTCNNETSFCMSLDPDSNTWTTEGCEYAYDCQTNGMDCCNCAVGIINRPIAIFSSVSPAPQTQDISTTEPAFLGPSGIAGVVAVVAVGIVGAILLYMAAQMFGSGYAPLVDATPVRAFSADAPADEARFEMQSTPPARQVISIGTTANPSAKSQWWIPKQKEGDFV